MASSTVGIGLTIGAVAQGTLGSVLSSTRRSLDGLTKSSRALNLAQIRVARDTRLGLAAQQSNYDRLGRALGRVQSAHDRLTAAAARSNAAIASGQQSWQRLATTAMAAWGVVRGGVATAGQAAHFADTLRDTRIKGRLSAAQESSLGDTIRAHVATTNQSRDDLALGAHQLITGGASFEQTQSQLGLLGDTMTALRTSSDETTGAFAALRDMGAADRAAMQGGIERLIAVGEKGQFTPDMMIRAFARLGDTIKASGVKGETAIAELAAGLQVAEGTMGAARSEAGLQSWLSGLNDPKVAAAYERAGVDYKTSMAELQKSGLSQYQASLELASAFMRDNLAAADQQALLNGDDDGRISTMLAEMGLTDIFKDANAARFALTVGGNPSAVKDMANASGEGSLAALKKLREASPIEQMKALKNSVSTLALDIGHALLPSILSLTHALTPLVAGIADFARAHPGVVTAIGAIVTGFVGLRVATVAGTFAWRQIMIVFTQGVKVFQTLRAVVALAQAQLALFRSGSLLASGTLVGKLVVGVKVAARALMWLGRAALMNPIGLAVTAIAGAAFLLIKYWQPIKGFFKGVGEAVTGVFTGTWQRIKEAFSGGIAGVSKLIIDWSPLGLFYKVFAGVFNWFGAELPANFSDFGKLLMDGLIGGITNMITSVRDSIVGIGESVVGWFRDKLGINSPSRVFAGLGAGIPEGTAQGITGSQGLVKKAALGMATATAVTLAPPTFAVPEVPASFMQNGGGAGGGMVIHFSPTIYVQGAGDVRGQVEAALNDGFVEFKRHLQRYKAEENRRVMGTIGTVRGVL